MSHTPGPWNIHPHYYPIDGEETVCADFRALTISIAKGEQLLGEASAFNSSASFARVLTVPGMNVRGRAFELTKAQ